MGSLNIDLADGCVFYENGMKYYFMILKHKIGTVMELEWRHHQVPVLQIGLTMVRCVTLRQSSGTRLATLTLRCTMGPIICGLTITSRIIRFLSQGVTISKIGR